MSLRRDGALCAALSAMVLTACGGAAGEKGQAVMQFPDRGVLTRLASQPAVEISLKKTAHVVDEWTIEAAPAVDKAQEAWTASTQWETLYADVMNSAAKKPRMTLGMACMARELGRFYLERKELPDDDLHRFMLGGCGNLVPDVEAEYVTLQVPEKMDDESIFKEKKDDFRKHFELTKSMSGNADIAGFWMGRSKDMVVTFVVRAVEPAVFKPFSLTPDSRGEVVIEGQYKGETQFFQAYANYGSASVNDCEIDMAMRRPNFRFICKTYEKDENAWVQMSAAPPQRALATVFGQFLLRKTADGPVKYHAMRFGDPAPVKTADEFTTTVMNTLNAVRKAAQLQEVTLAKAQSQSATAASPHYFASAAGQTAPEQADTIALALLAGWDVAGMIRNGHLVSTTAMTLDANRWLTSALEMPIGRRTLFDPEIEQVAFGPTILGKDGAIGSIAIGYRFHHESDHAEDEAYLLTRVIQARRRMNLSAPQRLGGVDTIMNEELGKLHTGAVGPRASMQAVLERAVAQTSRGMQAHFLQTPSLDELELPAEVLEQKTLHLDIGVTHYKPEGAAWAQYAILVVYAVDG